MEYTNSNPNCILSSYRNFSIDSFQWSQNANVMDNNQTFFGFPIYFSRIALIGLINWKISGQPELNQVVSASASIYNIDLSNAYIFGMSTFEGPYFHNAFILILGV